MGQYYPPLLRLKPIREVLRDTQRALLGLHPGEPAVEADGKTPVFGTETLSRTRNVQRRGATYEVRTRVWKREPDPDPPGLMTITDHAFEARCVALIAATLTMQRERAREDAQDGSRNAEERCVLVSAHLPAGDLRKYRWLRSRPVALLTPAQPTKAELAARGKRSASERVLSLCTHRVHYHSPL